MIIQVGSVTTLSIFRTVVNREKLFDHAQKQLMREIYLCILEQFFLAGKRSVQL